MPGTPGGPGGGCEGPGIAFRTAGPADAVGLRDLEQEAGLAAHGHIFPPERFPYPAADVLARWHLALAEPGLVTERIERDGLLVGLVAYDAGGTLRHLAVTPGSWGHGVAGAGVARAVAWMRGRGLDTARLWCLAENHRARSLYEHLGWRPTGASRPAAWSPFPTELEYARGL